MKALVVPAVLLCALPAAAQLPPPGRVVQAPPPGAMTMDDALTAKLQVSRLEQQVAELKAQLASLKAEVAAATARTTATDTTVAVLRKEFDTHDHIFMHPEQSAKTTYYTPEITTVRRKFCHIESENNPAATASKKAVCSIAASAE